MPINDPIGRAKVAPGSLAFERRRSGGTVMFAGETVDPAGPTYQQTINIYYQPRFNIYQTVQGAKLEAQRILRNVSDAELRAKAAISDWHKALEWDTDAASFPWQSSNVGAGYPNPLVMNHEVLRCPGVISTDPWKFYVPSDAVGVWHFDVALFCRFSPGDRLVQARLAVHRNGVLWRDFDLTNSSFNDKQHIEECYVDGSFLLPMSAGDYVQFYLMLVDDGSGTRTGTLTSTSYYGYVSGHRVSCKPVGRNDDEDYYINTPTTGRSFNNAP
jgi:hypothetical protein